MIGGETATTALSFGLVAMEHLPATESRFENLSTHLSVLRAAHEADDASARAAARQLLVLRYQRAIRSYLGALLRDDDDADEATQEVIVKVLRGDFAGADSERGRFRAYLKTAARNTALHWLRRNKSPGSREFAEEPAAVAAEDAWLAEWRQMLLDAAWNELRVYETRTPGNAFASVLELIGNHPEQDSAQLAVLLSKRLARPFGAEALRKQLSRARRKLAELLVAELCRTIDNPTPDDIEAELAEVGLLRLVRDYLPQTGDLGVEPVQARR
jgi:RNA polymerase sigma factor (sigma-70 family)